MTEICVRHDDVWSDNFNDLSAGAYFLRKDCDGVYMKTSSFSGRAVDVETGRLVFAVDERVCPIRRVEINVYR